MRYSFTTDLVGAGHSLLERRDAKLEVPRSSLIESEAAYDVRDFNGAAFLAWMGQPTGR
ncbi:type II toxin-antitoxin system ParD family antitoxin [Methylobacterium sp. E-066]|nr:type II toxin-antitoxin system ParD family antitoxin [Methylobacterium sp. E-066]